MAGSGSRERETEVAERSLQSAENCLLQRNYGRAFAHFLLVLKLTPERKNQIKENFTLALKEWADQLEESERMGDLLSCYQQAYELFPECETMLNNMGAQLFRLGFVDEAACYFRNALKLDPDFLQARDNLENICCHLVERWHFRMLNDHQRNSSFGYAIHRAISNGHDVVLDIGAGTGLLSLYAAEGEAVKIYGCEMSKTMYEMACDVIATNQMSDRIKMIHKKSTDLTIPEDLPERVSLVVTETFDAGLFGEHILTTLDHAWKYLLNNERHSKAKVLPYGATVFVSAIECESIRKQNRLIYPGMRHIDLCGVDVLCKTSNSSHGSSPSRDDVSTSYDASDQSDTADFEPYTTEKLSSIRGGYKLLSDVVAIMHFNFNDPDAIASYLLGIERHLSLTLTANGRVDALAMWFDLHLDEEISLSSAPQADSCWEQAIYPVLPSHLLHKAKQENFLVRQGDTLKIMCEYKEDALTFKCQEISRMCDLNLGTFPPRHSESMLFSASRTENDSISNSRSYDSIATNGHVISCLPTSHPEPNHRPITGNLSGNHGNQNSLNGRLPGDNPAMQQEQHKSDLFPSNHSGHHSNGLVSANECNIPSQNGHAAKHSQPTNQRDKYSTMTSSANSTSSTMTSSLTSRPVYFLERPELGRINDIDFNQSFVSALSEVFGSLGPGAELSLLDISRGVSLLPLQALQLGAGQVCLVGQSLQNQALLTDIARDNAIPTDGLCFEGHDFEFFDSNWTVLVTELVEPCGCLRQQVLEDIVLARVTCLRPDGVVIPSQAKVYGMLIESPSLHQDSAVISDENTSGFLIAGFMNDFVVTTHVDIDLATLEYKKLSDPFEMLTFDFSQRDSSSTTTSSSNENSSNVTTASPPGDIPNFLHQQRTCRITAVDSGQVTAVVYWFDMVLSPTEKLCTLDQKMHWKQAAVMQRQQITVSTGTELNVTSTCKNSCIDISLNLT